MDVQPFRIILHQFTVFQENLVSYFDYAAFLKNVLLPEKAQNPIVLKRMKIS